MKSEFWRVSSTSVSAHITRLLSTTHLNHCGKLFGFNRSSIVMEFADNGDLFQKITKHQKEQTYIKEEEVWRIFI